MGDEYYVYYYISKNTIDNYSNFNSNCNHSNTLQTLRQQQLPHHRSSSTFAPPAITLYRQAKKAAAAAKPSAPKDHVGPNVLDDLRAGDWSDGCPTQRLDELEARAARKTIHRERYEWVAPSRHKLGFDPRRRTSKRDVCSTLAQGVSDSEGWCNVANGSSSSNQDPHWHTFKARGRRGA